MEANVTNTKRNTNKNTNFIKNISTKVLKALSSSVNVFD